MRIAVEIVVTLLACYVLFSFAEWLIHKHLMHRKNWFNQRFHSLRNMLTSHARFHHGECFVKHFDHDDKLACNLFNLTLDVPWLGLLVIIVPLYCFFPAAAITLFVFTFLHHALWGVIHTEMHVPNSFVWARWLPWWDAWQDHHRAHHDRPNKNYCIVCLGADNWLGTKHRDQG